MRTHLAIFFANRGDVALQPCPQAPSAAAIHYFEKSCDKIAQPDWLTLLAIRGDERKTTARTGTLGDSGKFNRRYLTCQISAILYADRGDRQKTIAAPGTLGLVCRRLYVQNNYGAKKRQERNHLFSTRELF